MGRFYPPLILNWLKDGRGDQFRMPLQQVQGERMGGQEPLPLAAGSDLPRISSTKPYSTACSGVR